MKKRSKRIAVYSDIVQMEIQIDLENLKNTFETFHDYRKFHLEDNFFIYSSYSVSINTFIKSFLENVISVQKNLKAI